MQTLIARRQGMGLRVSSVVAVALALMVSALLFLSNPGVVYACKCAAPGAPAEELAKFDAVFTGRVISIEHSYDPNATTVSPEDRTTVGFEVSTVWKGDVLKSMDVTTPPTGGSCGFAFTEGEEYIVYASDSAYGDDGYTVGICSRTALLLKKRKRTSTSLERATLHKTRRTDWRPNNRRGRARVCLGWSFWRLPWGLSWWSGLRCTHV